MPLAEKLRPDPLTDREIVSRGRVKIGYGTDSRYDGHIFLWEEVTGRYHTDVSGRGPMGTWNPLGLEANKEGEKVLQTKMAVVIGLLPARHDDRRRELFDQLLYEAEID